MAFRQTGSGNQDSTLMSRPSPSTFPRSVNSRQVPVIPTIKGPAEDTKRAKVMVAAAGEEEGARPKITIGQARTATGGIGIRGVSEGLPDTRKEGLAGTKREENGGLTGIKRAERTRPAGTKRAAKTPQAGIRKGEIEGQAGSRAEAAKVDNPKDMTTREVPAALAEALNAGLMTTEEEICTAGSPLRIITPVRLPTAATTNRGRATWTVIGMRIVGIPRVSMIKLHAAPTERHHLATPRAAPHPRHTTGSRPTQRRPQTSLSISPVLQIKCRLRSRIASQRTSQKAIKLIKSTQRLLY